ncbi:MAG: tetratricopeptide repeat protein [Magnetococcales bacterium]|nr:tetratricopeptide repeat protein [Magnetococcales bacterium]
MSRQLASSQMGDLQQCHAAGLTTTPIRVLKVIGADWWKRGLEAHLKGDLVTAESCYLRITPDRAEYVGALGNLSIIRSTQGRLLEAEMFCRRALEIEPDYVNGYVNLANAQLSRGCLSEAEQSCRQALLRQADSILALATLGSVLQVSGRLEEAEQVYQTGLRHDPNSRDLWIGLGNMLFNSRRLQEAEVCFQKVLAVNPNDTAAMNNLGYVLISVGKIGSAHEILQRAHTIKPEDVQILTNLGLIHTELGQHAQADQCYRRILSMHPRHFEVWNNLLYLQNYYVEDAASGLHEALEYGKAVAKLARPIVHRPTPGLIHKKLRIGLVSGDLLQHPVGYFLENVLSAMNPELQEFYAYSNRTLEDDLTQRLKARMARWQSVVGLGDETVARMIHADGVDILLDLSGHSALNRLPVFAWKPAPVQISWLGYFATTGVSAMDYILGDPINLPVGEEGHFCETPWRLPDCYLCLTPPDPSPPVSELPVLTHGQFTFGSFNHLGKITDDVIHCWSRVLQRVPNSRLLLKGRSFIEPQARDRMTRRFAVHGIDANRLLLEEASSRDLYLARYHQVDMALDTFPYPGVTTSVEGLWMGVPCITRKGSRYLSHQGESILSCVGLSEWIAEDCNAYVDKAVAFAADRTGLARLRSELRTRALQSPLFDHRRFAWNLTQAWRQMWRIWCEAR